MTKKLFIWSWIVCLVSMLIMVSACSTTRNLPQGEYLLKRTHIASADKSVKLPSDMHDYLYLRSNNRIFGLFPLKLYIYNWSDSTSRGWWSRFCQKLGEPPVSLDKPMIAEDAIRLNDVMYSEGYLNSRTEYRIDTISRKKASVSYTIFPGQRFLINSYTQQIDDSRIRSIVEGEESKIPVKNKIIRIGSPLIPNQLEEERKRILDLLGENGYFGYDPNNIFFEVDTTKHHLSADLKLRIVNGNTPVYKIGDVVFTCLNDDFHGEKEPVDSLNYKGYEFVYYGKRMPLRPSVLEQNSFLKEGSIYRSRDLSRTYAALNMLQALKYSNVRLLPNDSLSTDSTRILDVNIVTQMGKSKQFTAELIGLNSAGDFGVASSLGFTHRNIFRGSETFTVKGKVGYEAISQINKNFLEYGVDASLRFPRILAPFFSKKQKESMKVNSELAVSYNFQTRPEFKRVLLSGRWSYLWNSYGKYIYRHQLKLVDVDFLHLPFIDPAFHASLPPSAELYNYTNQFIVGSGYTFTLSKKADKLFASSDFSLRVNLLLAGNALNLISKISRAKKDEHGAYSLFNINYAQFAKADIDIAKSFRTSAKSALALHLSLGVAYPYGNANHIPFELRYFGGGANTVRGWKTRELGPGSMPKSAALSIFNQAGDIKIFGNIEYRIKTFWRIQLAGYIDAGNIWTIKDYESQPDGQFHFDTFYKELALSYGLGFRLDFDYFLIRFDTGFKAYDPQEPRGKRWVIKRPNFGSNFAWHFSVGYPF